MKDKIKYTRLLPRNKILKIFFILLLRHTNFITFFFRGLVPRFRINIAISPPPPYTFMVCMGKFSLSTLPIKSTILQQQQRIKTCHSKVQCLNKYYSWYVWLRWKRTCRLQTQRFLIRHSVGGQLTECHYIYHNNILMKRIKLWWRHDMHWHLLTITTVIVYWGAQWLRFNVTTDQPSHLNKQTLTQLPAKIFWRL